jgi:hypothetical protein
LTGKQVANVRFTDDPHARSDDRRSSCRDGYGQGKIPPPVGQERVESRCTEAAREKIDKSRNGLDMTDEMLALARENQRKAGVTNVESRNGEEFHSLQDS